MTAVFHRVESDRDYEGYVAVWNAITPREPISTEVVRRRWAQHPERLYVIAEQGGRVVASGFAGWSDTPGRAFLAVRVLPHWRGRGIGGELHERCAAHARAMGARSLSGHVSEADRASLDFAEHRGYRAVGRQVELVRELRGDEQPPQRLDGIEIVELTSERRLAAYEVAREAFADMPLPDLVEPPPYDEWTEEEFDGPIAFAAVEATRLVGYASLLSRARPDLLEHGLTACLRTHRGRGIGTALKRTQIAWAARNGYRELITFTQEGNEAMRRVNEKLGYVEQPAWLTMRLELA